MFHYKFGGRDKREGGEEKGRREERGREGHNVEEFR